MTPTFIFDNDDQSNELAKTITVVAPAVINQSS